MADIVGAEFIALQQALLGRYSLERELGRGGMGVVYLARDVALDRPVAIKLLPPEMAAQPALRERFLREARTAAKLSHPNIVPIHAVEEADGFVFFVMALVEGESLGRRLRERGPLSPHEAARALQEVAWALGYAHGRGVVHRDVKPDNVMLEHGSGRAIVMDFGIARLTDTHGLTGAGEIIGTAEYMSPEQASGAALDGRSDIFSLGVVGFLALSGRLPFEAADVVGQIGLRLSQNAPPLASVTPSVPRRLAQAVDRCLARDPAARFATGEEFAEALATVAPKQQELPAPLRTWLTKGTGMSPAVGAWDMAVGLPAVIITLEAVWNLRPVNALVAAGVAAALLTVPYLTQAGYRLLLSRRLLRAGYGVDDIRHAVRVHAERRREELVAEAQERGAPTLLGRALRWLTVGALGVFGGALVTMPAWTAEAGIFLVLLGSGATTVLGLLIGQAVPGRPAPTADLAAERRQRFWAGRLGKLAARLAGWRLRGRAIPLELTHRPTELAIGLAADAVFASLPSELRKELRDVPAVVRRLETEAQQLRRIVTDLETAIATLGGATTPPSAALRAATDVASAVADERSRLRADIVVQRDGAARRLALAVAALENIRLDLLRLKAGGGTVQELTADLLAAREFEQQVDAVVAAQDEVRRLLGRRSSGTADA